MLNCKRFFYKFLSQGMIVLINVNVILICLLESVLYFSRSGSERLVGVRSRLFQTGVPSNTKHPALLPARKEWRRNEPAADERDARMLKKIENKRTCICVQKKKICSGTMLRGGGLQRATFDITVWLQTDWTREVKISLAHASLIIDLPGCDPGA